MGLEDLLQISSIFEAQSDDRLAIDFKSSDDASAIKLQDGSYMVQSVDFITPVVDDPYVYGQIAAANSLSDLFATGCEALTALNLLMWDKEHVGEDAVREILRGGFSKVREASCLITGGHSVIDVEQKYGLSVTGIVKNEAELWRNNAGLAGDALVLTKPLGSGIIISALKSGALTLKDATPCIENMRTLNLYAMRVAKGFDIHACTDITGFGLLGHLNEMLGCHLSATLFLDKVPIYEAAKKAYDKGIFPGGSSANKRAIGGMVEVLEAKAQKIVESQMLETTTVKNAKIDSTTSADNAKVTPPSTKIASYIDILYDAQTSGGLLLALDEGSASALVEDLIAHGVSASIIGRLGSQGRDSTKKIAIEM